MSAASIRAARVRASIVGMAVGAPRRVGGPRGVRVSRPEAVRPRLRADSPDSPRQQEARHDSPAGGAAPPAAP